MDKRRAAAAAAAVAAAGIITNAAFETPALLWEPTPVIENLDQDDAPAPEDRQRSPLARVRARMMALPWAIRALVGVPLWGIGWTLTTALAALWTGVSAPALTHVLEWLLTGAIAAAAFAASLKAAFPELPAKEIFHRRNMVPLLGTTALLAAGDFALFAVWKVEFPRWVWQTGSVAVLTGLGIHLLLCERRRIAEEALQKADRPLSKDSIEQIARRLADTVCPRRFG